MGSRVKRPAVNFAARGADQFLRARQHFLGGTTRKRQEEDAVGANSCIDQVSDTVNERSSLSGSGPSDDEKWPVAVRRCCGLLGIQLCCEVPF